MAKIEESKRQDSAESVVLEFIRRVRSGKAPEDAALFMAGTVRAHQVVSGDAQVIERTPQNYAAHIREFVCCYGQYEFRVEETIAQHQKVYVRWRQIGSHVGDINGFAPTGLPLVTVGSAVYLVESGRIVEYWIQQENEGLHSQLKRNAEISTAAGG